MTMMKMMSISKMRKAFSFSHLNIFFPLIRLTVNDVEEGPSCHMMNSNPSGQSTPIEQNLPQHFALALRSNPITTTQAGGGAAAASSIILQPDLLTNEPITLSVLSADIDDIVQHAFETWKNEMTENTNETLSYPNEEDFLLADLLQRSENEQQNIILHSMG